MIRTVRGEGYLYDPGIALDSIGSIPACCRATTEADDVWPEMNCSPADFYRVPLPETLTDSTHGEMRAFELNTVRVRDADGAEGVGYTFTVGAQRRRDRTRSWRASCPDSLTGEDADRIEHLWQKLWWALHYGGRGGPTVLAISAVDMALWDLKAKRAGRPLWRLLGGHDPRVPCYAGGIDLLLPLDALLRQTDGNLARGFRAIKMKVGRPALAEDVERVAAMRAASGRRLPADGRRQHALDGRPGDPRGAGLRRPRSGLAGGAGRSRRPARPRARRARRAALPSHPARTCAASGTSAI